jgi:hypothetical protein
MPWSHFVALAARATRFTAREVFHAMSVHSWALRCKQSDGPGLVGLREEYEHARQLAYPGSPATRIIALKQSSE